MKRADLFLAFLLALLAFVSRVLFRYVDGFGDNNVIHMALGMSRGVAFDVPFGDTLQYGKNFSLGVYVAFRALYPLFFEGPAAVVSTLNWVGVGSATLLYPALYSIYRISVSARSAFIACLLVMGAPVVWENETYFQPICLALLALSLSVIAFRSPPLRASRLPVATIFAVLALSLRSEIVLLLPGLLAYAYVSGGRRRLLEALAVSGVAAGVLAIGLLSLSAEETRGTSFPEYVRRYFEAFVRMRAVGRNLFWATLGVGAANALLCVSILWTELRRHRAKAEFLIPAFMALCVLFFWISNSVPLVRHFYLMLPPMAWLIVRSFGGRRGSMVWLTAILALNLLLPEVVYRWIGPDASGDERVAHGSFFSAHSTQAAKVRRARAFAVEAADRLLASDQDASSRRVAMPVTWTLFGYLEQELIVRGVQLREVNSSQLEEGITVKEFDVGSMRLRQIRTNWVGESAIDTALRVALEDSAERGWQLWIPEEFDAVLPLRGDRAGQPVRL